MAQENADVTEAVQQAHLQIEKIFNFGVESEKLEEQKQPLHLLSKIFANIVKHPNEDKYKRINVLNPKFQTDIPILDILKSVGFELQSKENNKEYWTFNDNKFIILKSANDLIQKKNNSFQKTLKEKQNEEYKQKIIEENKAKMKAWKLEQSKGRSDILKKMKNAKKDQDYAPPACSVAKKRKFGATHVKVEFKNKGGG